MNTELKPMWAPDVCGHQHHRDITQLDDVDLRLQCVYCHTEKRIPRPTAAEQNYTPLPDGWTGLTADLYEGEMPQEAVYVDTITGEVLPGACANQRPGTSICTRPAGHPSTRHVAHDGGGGHRGEWDV